MSSCFGWKSTGSGLFVLLYGSLVREFMTCLSSEEPMCKNVDIRNSVHNFRKVENCTVIEGYLQILLIDNGQTHEYERLLFPKLVEITGYLLLYRAFGMNSVGRIFPNLAVIRGNVLFHNYALVIFEMYHLQEIGLYHLTDILRGSVRIEKNPGLCYVDTVDWDLIAKEGKGGHFFKHNKKKDECPNVCPINSCPNTTRDGKLVPLCWNSQHCQKVCPVTCEKNSTCSDDPSGYCCQQECLGGCYGRTAFDCVACKHVLFDGKCLKKCPPGTFELIGRRCVQELECRKFDEKDSNNNKIYWKPFQGHCISECPPGYIEAGNDRHHCKQCIGKCPKICKGMVVDHMNAAQKFHGCTVINGSLEIHIRGGSNVIKELEESMSLVEEIHGYLKIARSFPLISLNFLKSLRIIHGDQLDKKNYAFLVLDNQNLQELWDWKSRKERLQIRKGKIFFHFNSKLCVSKIEELKKHADVLEWDDRDVSPSSNGDRVACDVTNMNVSVGGLGPRSVKVKFESFQKYLHDERSLLGYVIYYREAPYQNITIFEGRDACGSDVWTVRDVEISDLTDSHIEHVITDLKPFTQYALYIRTYTTASGRKGAQSSIVYFKTEPDIPSPPINIKAHSTLHGEIVISWDPPKKPNGNVTHYIIEGSNDEDLSGLINQRNYCSEPITYSDYKRIHDDAYDETLSYKHISLLDYLNTTTPDSNEEDSECCSCANDLHSVNYDDEEAEFQIHFEDFLQNTVYIKNRNIHRLRRHINLLLPGREKLYLTDQDLNSLPISHSIDGDKFVNNYLYQFKKLVYDRPFLVVSNLKHFTEYTVEIRACQDRRSGFKAEFCSLKAITSVRTLALEGADDIRSNSLHVQTENMTAAYSAFVRWEEPKNPNGVIVAYILEYHRLDGDHFKPNRICITRSNYLQHYGYYLSELPPGNYSLRVKASSLAKYGNWTAYVFFKIAAVSEYSSSVIAAIAVGAIIVLILIVSFATFGYHIKYKRRIPDYVDYASVNPEYISSNLVYEPDEWEIPREKVKLLEELGQGSFGMVYKGEVHDLNGKVFIPCAAKTVNESATLREKIEFLQEASVMKTFVDCNHVVRLLGVVSKGQPTLVIMELMANGDLKSYLRSHRPDSEENPGAQPPTLRQILQMAAEIADGMAYLAAKKFVHRDLAARNCMVAEDMTVKIGDFGMTRDVYETDYYRKGGKGLLPVRWMSPESLQDGIFDCQSDVWSYGVVLWEMATLASQPYQGLSNEDVLKFVIAGNTMVKPEDCPENLYRLMAMCWQKNPKARPTFIEIIEMLLSDLNEKFHQVSFYYTQHVPNCADHEDADAPTSPLRSPTCDEDNDQSVYRYFPSATQMPEENRNFIFDNGDAIASCSNYAAEASNSNEGSKAVSINYSDGSKGSKISNISNGSIPNGHVHLTLERASEC